MNLYDLIYFATPKANKSFKVPHGAFIILFSVHVGPKLNNPTLRLFRLNLNEGAGAWCPLSASPEADGRFEYLQLNFHNITVITAVSILADGTLATAGSSLATSAWSTHGTTGG